MKAIKDLTSEDFFKDRSSDSHGRNVAESIAYFARLRESWKFLNQKVTDFGGSK